EILEIPLENINGQLVTNVGQKYGTEFQVTEPISGHQEHPDIAQISSADTYAIWQSYEKRSQKYWGISGKSLTTAGVPEEDETLYNPSNNRWNQEPSIASDGNGNIGIVWVGLNGQKYKKAIYYERISE
ncbi:hypothetical protein KKA95_02280, partial [Patescibacteria group bacterium]|nr:hypothetical protein [Patescibacteria group bacterium]